MTDPHFSKMVGEMSRIAAEVGQFQLSHFRSVTSQAVSDKGLNQLVSFVDKESELQLAKQLTSLFPEAGFIGEEDMASQASNSGWNWIVDPLDGTTNFLHGLPVFAISIALVHHLEPMAAVVFAPALNENFYAWHQGGAFLNGQPIKTTQVEKLSESLVATGFPYFEFEGIDGYLSILHHFMKSTHGIRRMGSAAIDLAYVADGRFDAFFEYGLNAWDVAAGALLVKEAGGMVSDFSMGNEYLFGKQIIATNTPIYPSFAQEINKHLA